jgi:hypothetical protein
MKISNIMEDIELNIGEPMYSAVTFRNQNGRVRNEAIGRRSRVLDRMS